MAKLYKILLMMVLTGFLAGNSARAQSPENRKPDPVVRCYPNPATTQITFDIHREDTEVHHFQIFSFLGRKMYERSQPPPRTVVNLQDFYRGIYVYQLRDRNGRLLDSGKFQVAR